MTQEQIDRLMMQELMVFGKYEKETGRLIGFLSAGKRRWLPVNSKHQYLIIRTEAEAKKIEMEFDSLYSWQKSYKYYFSIETYKSARLK